MAAPGSSSTAMSATYLSPSNEPFEQSVTVPLPASSNGQQQFSTTEKSAYLAALRDATKKLQESVNKALTERMEEDNARAAAGGAGASSQVKGGVDEAKEEDNYGEEVVDED